MTMYFIKTSRRDEKGDDMPIFNLSHIVHESNMS